MACANAPAEQTWPDGQMPYVIDSSIASRTSVIEEAISWINAGSNCRVVPRSGESAYVRFTEGNGCSSYVGRQGTSSQVINVDPLCITDEVMHEIMHAFGVLHEHQREDRDTYVTIDYFHIESGYEDQFDILSGAGAETIGDYSYPSVMHYPHDAFSWTTMSTIIPEDDDITKIGQTHNSLHADDAATLAYFCPPPVCPLCYDGVCTMGATVTDLTCVCNAGATGEQCDYEVCPMGCGQGRCSGTPDVCDCLPGWQASGGSSGPCDTAICAQDCLISNGGECTAPDVCSCNDPDWTNLGLGGSCSIPVCSQGCVHGSCDSPGVCTCTDPKSYRGADCGEEICAGGCGEFGRCTGVTNVCECLDGYEEDDDGKCQCVSASCECNGYPCTRKPLTPVAITGISLAVASIFGFAAFKVVQEKKELDKRRLTTDESKDRGDKLGATALLAKTSAGDRTKAKGSKGKTAQSPISMALDQAMQDELESEMKNDNNADGAYDTVVPAGKGKRRKTSKANMSAIDAALDGAFATTASLAVEGDAGAAESKSSAGGEGEKKRHRKKSRASTAGRSAGGGRSAGSRGSQAGRKSSTSSTTAGSNGTRSRGRSGSGGAHVRPGSSLGSRGSKAAQGRGSRGSRASSGTGGRKRHRHSRARASSSGSAAGMI